MSEIIQLHLTENDVVLPCPFCASEEIELANTWTACYWLECQRCGCEMHDRNLAGDPVSVEAHQASKSAVIAAWNQRAEPMIALVKE